MSVAESDEIIYKIEKYLDGYDRILIFMLDNVEITNFFQSFIFFIKQKQLDKKYLVVINKNEQRNDLSAISEFVDVFHISSKELNFLMEIYREYEFSDRVVVMPEGANYPGILNYYRLGVLKETECFEALLR